MYLLKSCLWIVLVSLLLSSNIVHSQEEVDGSEGAEQQEEGASEQKDQTPRIGHLDLNKQTQEALTLNLRPEEAVWLDVEYPTPEGVPKSKAIKTRVLSLQRASLKPQQHGAVLLISEKGQHADWPQVIRPIRSYLPESGWYTLSVSLPGEMMGLIPERVLPVKKFDEVTLSPALKDALSRNAATGKSEEENAEASDESTEENLDEATEEDTVENTDEDDESVDIDLADKKDINKAIPYQDKALAHVNAGMDYLQKQGYQNIVLLAYRSSVNIAMAYLKQKQGTFRDKGFALVLVDPIFNDDLQLDLSEVLGKNFLPPVLEIVNADEDKSLVQTRLASAKVAGAQRYMQVNYAFKVSEGSQKNLARRVRFWLEKHAPGMMVGPAR